MAYKRLGTAWQGQLLGFGQGEVPTPILDKKRQIFYRSRKGDDWMTRLAEFAQLGMWDQSLRLADIADEEITIQDVRFADSEYGEIAFMTVQRGDGTQVSVMTGGVYILPALHKVMDKQMLPAAVKFVKKGRAWVFE